MSSQKQRRAKWEREYHASREEVRTRSAGRCEMPDCISLATSCHHKLMGRTHPRCNEPEFLMNVCDLHHALIHGHPEISYEAGWLLHDWDVPRDAA